MSFGRYGTYTDLGQDWLGPIPAHWDARRLGNFFTERREKVSDRDYEPLSVTKGGVVPRLETAAKTDDGENRKRVAAGDFVINSRSDRNGSAGVAPHDGSVSLICTVLTPRPDVHGPFIHHLLRSPPFQQEFYRYGRGIVADLWSTNYSEMRNIMLAMPSTEEQRAIAAFLDRETAKIDALVAEQERLMALLKEKRQAVISHAVTKGLDPDAPMKASGVEWLGEVPAHWDVCKIKFVARLESGHTPDKKIAEYWDGGDVPWVSLNDTGFLKANDYISETAFSITHAGIANSSARMLPERCVVFSRDATIGRCAITTRPMTVSQHFIAWVCTPMILPEFLLHCLRSMIQELERLCTGATLKTIGLPDVKTLIVPVPSVSDQRAIVAHISETTTTIDDLIRGTEETLSLLVERRAALISAAVTGQIDVRHLASADAA